MENKALRRLSESVGRLVDERRDGDARQEQLARALAKSREELERLLAQQHIMKTERTEVRKRLDVVIKRVEGLVQEDSEES